MFKKIITYFILYILLTFIFLLVIFPYTKVANFYVKDFIERQKLPIKYSELKVTPTSFLLKKVYIKLNKKTKIFNIIKIDYSLLSFFSKKASLHIDNSYFNFKLRNNVLFFNGTLSHDILPDLYIQQCKLSIKGNIDLTSLNGIITSKNINRCIIRTPVGKVKFTNINIEANTKNMIMYLTSNATGIKTNARLKGKVYIYKKNISRSRISLTGNFSVNSFKSKFKIVGTISNPIIRF